jgi:hypothetical protein
MKRTAMIVLMIAAMTVSVLADDKMPGSQTLHIVNSTGWPIALVP